MFDFAVASTPDWKVVRTISSEELIREALCSYERITSKSMPLFDFSYC